MPDFFSLKAPSTGSKAPLWAPKNVQSAKKFVQSAKQKKIVKNLTFYCIFINKIFRIHNNFSFFKK
jgi:hypothetical protein